MEITYREIIASALLLTFLFVLLLPPDFITLKQGYSGTLKNIPLSNSILNISGANLSIQFDGEKDGVLCGTSEEIALSFDKEKTLLNKVSGSVIIGTKVLENVNISAVDVFITGAIENVVVNISSVNVTSRNLLINAPAKIKISTATINGELYIDEFSSEGKVEILVDSASTNLTVYVKKGCENKVTIQGRNIIVKNW